MPTTSIASPAAQTSFGVLAGWDTLEIWRVEPHRTLAHPVSTHGFGVELFDATRGTPLYLDGSSGGGAACCCCSCSSSGARESQ